MYPVSDLGSEDVIDEAVLGQAVQPAEGGRRHDRVEMMAVAGNTGYRVGDRGLDPVFQLLGGRRHTLKGTEADGWVPRGR